MLTSPIIQIENLQSLLNFHPIRILDISTVNIYAHWLGAPSIDRGYEYERSI